MSLFQKLAFVRSAHEIADLPAPLEPEIAFAGRSNAGKSSAINALAGRRRLAFVSKTPGRTQLINLFRLGEAYLVDLPGYGYAKVPGTMRAHWDQLLPRYLGERSSVTGLVLIMDARHPMTDLDITMIDWFSPSARPVHILLSKADKLTRNEARDTQRNVERQLQERAPTGSVQLFSSVTRDGVDQAQRVICGWLGVPEPAPLRAAPKLGKDQPHWVTRKK
jgi:GTP-binding protein